MDATNSTISVDFATARAAAEKRVNDLRDAEKVLASVVAAEQAQSLAGEYEKRLEALRAEIRDTEYQHEQKIKALGEEYVRKDTNAAAEHALALEQIAQEADEHRRATRALQEARAAAAYQLDTDVAQGNALREDMARDNAELEDTANDLRAEIAGLLNAKRALGGN
jgi:hypothetical protein